jgi:hypothetical protein
MKKIILVLIYIFTYYSVYPQNWLWEKAIGPIRPGFGGVQAMVSDSFGNTYTLGVYIDTIDFDPGPAIFNLTAPTNDRFILKLNSAGNFVWAKSLAYYALSFAIDALSNVYVTGYFQGIIDFDPGPGIFNLNSNGNEVPFVLKLNSAGNFIWAKAMVGGGAHGNSVATDNSCNVYITGGFNGTTDFDPGVGNYSLTSVYATNDTYICKLDSSGNFVWAGAIGGPGPFDISYSIATDPSGSGDVYICGLFRDTTDFDPGPGTFNLVSTSQTNGDIFICKLDNSGNFSWAIKYYASLPIPGRFIAVDMLSNVYVTGSGTIQTDFDPDTGTYYLSPGPFPFITKVNSAGHFVWAKSAAGGKDICLDASANIYTTGALSGTFDFDPDTSTTYNITSCGGSIDFFISKLDSAGYFNWATSGGGTNTEVGFGISVDAVSNVYCAGIFRSQFAIFSTDTIFNADTTMTYTNIFIAKYGSITTGNNELTNILLPVSLSPNPATNQLTIDNGEWKIESVEVYDVMGESVIVSLTPSPSSSGEGSVRLDVSSLASGIYFVKVKGDKEERMGKFVKLN